MPVNTSLMLAAVVSTLRQALHHFRARHAAHLTALDRIFNLARRVLCRLRTRCAKARTSSATTAKPIPASPARAASTAAFNASRFV